MANSTADESTTSTTTTTMTGTPSPTGAVHPNRRRIIKAAPPKVSSKENTNDVNQLPNNVDKDDESSNGKKKKLNYNPLLKDDPQELADEWREERFKVTNRRGKALREKEIAARRKQPTSETANLSANPFSRFLSVFSVEPKFPEHKRSLEKEDDDQDLKGPDEKRLKSSDSVAEPGCDDGSSNTNSKDGTGVGGTVGKVVSSKALWVTAAVAVVAVVAVALQRGRKK